MTERNHHVQYSQYYKHCKYRKEGCRHASSGLQSIEISGRSLYFGFPDKAMLPCREIHECPGISVKDFMQFGYIPYFIDFVKIYVKFLSSHIVYGQIFSAWIRRAFYDISLAETGNAFRSGFSSVVCRCTVFSRYKPQVFRAFRHSGFV